MANWAPVTLCIKCSKFFWLSLNCRELNSEQALNRLYRRNNGRALFKKK